jgi:hypothetical protein
MEDSQGNRSALNIIRKHFSCKPGDLAIRVGHPSLFLSFFNLDILFAFYNEYTVWALNKLSAILIERTKLFKKRVLVKTGEIHCMVHSYRIVA